MHRPLESQRPGAVGPKSPQFTEEEAGASGLSAPWFSHVLGTAVYTGLGVQSEFFSAEWKKPSLASLGGRRVDQDANPRGSGQQVQRPPKAPPRR